MQQINRRGFVGNLSGLMLASGSQLFSTIQAAGPGASTTVRLPVPPRLQWDELDGYCGECCVQQAALYFGTYVSQYVCRSIINPNQKSQLLVGINDQDVLKALRLTSAEFDYNKTVSPQFQQYFIWLKQQLSQLHPVLITAYVQGMNDSDYDHIMLATGYSSTDNTAYHATDQLYFNDNYSPTPYVRVASTLNDNRRMRVNGARYEYCIPTNVDYGCAVTGIQDTSGAALPVQMVLNRWNEPDIVAGAAPEILSATVSVSGLTPGRPYSLYRYNDYRNVPLQNYSKSSYSAVVNFIATQNAANINASIPSNGVAIFRCLPAGK